MRSRLSIVCSFMCCLFFSTLFSSAGARATVTVAQGAPQGFESLEAPRATMVTLYHGGELLGNFSAHYTPAMIAFDNPMDILATLESLTDETQIATILANPMPSHPELVCGRRKQACGTLEPDVAGIIFDEDKLTAELFISRDYLSVEEGSARYLPLPERKFSTVYRLDGAASGTDQDNPNFALGSTAVYSFGEGNLTSQTSVSNDGVRFDTVSAGIERKGWAANAGLVRSAAMQLASDRDIAGASFSTSMRTRLDAHKIEGNDLIVYLPRRAFISIYREGRLYSAHSYEAGNQRLNTSELPDGAYNVTLKIQESDGQSREETRFFAKSEQLPPPDAPTYYAQAGVLREQGSNDSTIPELTDDPLVRVGTVQRVADNVGLGVAALGISDRAVVETSAFVMQSGLQLRATALASSRGDKGVAATMVYIGSEWSASADARALATGDALEGEYEGLLSDINQISFNLNYMLTSDVSVSGRGSYSHNKGAPSTTSFGPALSWRLWQEGESMLYFSADAARTMGKNEGTALLRFTRRIGKIGISSEGGANAGGNRPGGFGTLRASHDDTSPDGALILGANVHTDPNAKSLGADGDWRGSFGRAQGAVQRSLGDSSLTTYGGNFAIGAASTLDAIHVGGREADMSAVMIEAEGNADTELTVYVNASPRATVKVGSRQVIYLSPYNVYTIRVAPSKGGLYHVEGGERKVTLYPGNVTRLTWQVDRFTVVAARVVTADGSPLADAALAGDRANITTDENGRFQAELTKLDTLTFTQANGATCNATLPPQAANNGVMLLREPIMCR